MFSVILRFVVFQLLLSEASPKLIPANVRNFVSCLYRQGLSENSFIPRDDSEPYRTLNYQEQEYPGQILPLAFVLPENEQDVQNVVKCGRNYSVRLVPKSGGHSAEKYSFGDSKSVVVDLRKLNQVQVDGDGRLVVVGSGTLLGPLLQTLWKEGHFFIPTGSCPTVGIGGHATGGGHGFFSRSYGIALDHILEIRIVTANGQLVTANNGQNSDLFWALRGAGGGSFGIVTSFVFKIQKAPPLVLVGTLKFNVSQFQDVFLAWEQFTLNGSRNLGGEFNIFQDRGIEIYFFDSTGVAENFERLCDTFPPTQSKSMTSYTFPEFLFYQSYNFSGEMMMRRQEMKQQVLTVGKEAPVQLYPEGKSFFVGKSLNSNSAALLQALFKDQPETITVRFEAYGGAINDLEPHETAFVHRRGRLANAVVTFEPSSSSNLNQRGIAWMERYLELGKVVWGRHETYQNYADGKLRDYLQQYYGSNLRRLIKIKQKYDQHNYFNQPQSIPTRSSQD